MALAWSDHAKTDSRDLRNIHDFIAINSRHSAKQVTNATADKTLLISDLPNIAKLVPAISEEDFHELRMNSYSIL